MCLNEMKILCKTLCNRSKINNENLEITYAIMNTLHNHIPEIDQLKYIELFACAAAFSIQIEKINNNQSNNEYIKYINNNLLRIN